MTRITSPLKWHGGKHYLAPALAQMALTIPHKHRVEVYGGGLSFTLACEPEGYSEVVNDVDRALQNFWLALCSPDTFPELLRRLSVTPVCEELWGCTSQYDLANPGDQSPDTVIERAHAFFILCRQSLAGRMESFAPLSKTRTRRGMNEQVSAWLSAVEGLPAVHERLRRVAIRNADALKLIQQEDSEDTLFYCDPPYLPETRTSTDVYTHEMTPDQHEALLRALRSIKGKFLLSGYRNAMYDFYAGGADWTRVDFDLPNNAAGGSTKRRMTECVWSNWPVVKPE